MVSTKYCVFIFFFYVSHSLVFAQDSLTINHLDSSLDSVSILRVLKTVPITTTKISSEELEIKNLGQDLPILIKNTPNLITTSDAGAGIGYTSLRIRGLDQTRINVSLNGIPLNDSESQNIFWVNMPDLASSISELYIQRGVGTSNFGPASFGAAMNIEMENPEKKPYFYTSNSVGSFDSYKNTFKGGSGVFNNYFSIDGRLSFIHSDGYIDRASSKLSAFEINNTFEKGNTRLRFIILGGKEITYQAWYGINKAQLEKNRKYNPAGEIYDSDGALTGFYPDEVDNYKQNHYQLIWDQKLKKRWSTRVVMHYTHGAGFYEEYQDEYANNHIFFTPANTLLTNYKIKPLIINGDTINQSDLIRRRWLDNYFYGISINGSKTYRNLKIYLGLAANRYEGNHFGKLLWTKEPALYQLDQEFYRNYSIKNEINSYGKATWKVKKTEFFSDIQIRWLAYNAKEVTDGQNIAIEGLVNFNHNYFFINPKIGVQQKIKSGKLYLSGGVARREPTRSDLINNPDIEPESLYDIEMGLNLNKSKNILFNVDFYYMYFINQLVLTGEINDVGAFLRQNVGTSYRMGLEIEGSYRLNNKISFFGNIAWSRNRILNHKETVGVADGESIMDFGNTEISYSPSLIGNIGLSSTFIKNLYINLTSKYVSSQYMSNANFEASKLNSYFITDFLFSYQPKWDKKNIFKDLKFSLLINNIFNEKYENNGYYFNFYDGNTQDVMGLNHNSFYYPQAGVNFLLGIEVKL